MSVAVLAPQPIVPVIDERLHFPSDATKSHKDKINSYNDLLEDVFHRELELSRLKASLVDMKVEIVEEAQTLDTTGQVISPESLQRVKAGETENHSSSESGEEGEGTGSDSAVSGEEGAAGKKDSSKKKRRAGGKGKSKGKGRDATRAEERSANWDYYNLSVAGGNRRARVAEDDE